MTTTRTDAVTLDTLLADFPLPALEPGQTPTQVWGYFETVDDDGDATWHERASEGADPSTVYAEVSGYLAGLEAADVWFDDDELVGDPEDDDEADVPESPLDERFSSLSIGDFGDEELTGRFLLLVISTDADGEPARDVYSPELSDEEVLGLLRLAQLRLTEQLAWDVPSPQATALSEAPELVPLTSLFPGWEFETVDDVANVTAVWALIETIDDEGTVTWVQRESDGLALGELLSLIAVRVTGTEERLLADWGLSDLLAAEEEAGGADLSVVPGSLEDDSDDRDDAVLLADGAFADAEDTVEGSDEDELDDELDEFAPLDDRFEALQVAGLPAGAVARRALLLVLAEEDGASPRFALYGAAPEEELDYPYIDDIEELGLLRSQERRLRLDLAW
ncbi:hypothetical protein DWB68_06865 [Galactobacter valiniphilus]|uniref:Uncharacterized protein n=1 Tax=Galactobacter valiniphilus TaxID=2676122 RepID=A0A399JJ38_9MICC|nr:hypothetical protein [Galactobacter valiniphilus]RII42466.1 hypothetical protein DWB68_06865 [Galactobacter valiniphilus]